MNQEFQGIARIRTLLEVLPPPTGRKHQILSLADIELRPPHLPLLHHHQDTSAPETDSLKDRIHSFEPPTPMFMRMVSKGSAFIRRWLRFAAASLSSTSLELACPSSGAGCHSLTTGSMPEVARSGVLGWPW